MTNQLFTQINQHVNISADTKQMLSMYLQQHKLQADCRLPLRNGDIVFLAEGIIKKVGLPDGDIKDFIGPNGFIIIPPKEHEEFFMTISEVELISLSEADFITITNAHPYLLPPYQKLIMHWQRRRSLRSQFLLQDKKKAKDLFPKCFKGIAHHISSKDKAKYLGISYNYYSSL